MPEPTPSNNMAKETNPQLVIATKSGAENVDATRALNQKAPQVEPVMPPLPEGAVDKAVVAGAGVLVGRFFDAIADAKERDRVKNLVEESDDKYKNDEFRHLSYGELRVVLSTGRSEGKKLDEAKLEDARASRRLRYEEAAKYGTMTGVEGALKTNLIAADWSDYQAAVARTAAAAERDAKAISAYASNPRIEGVVYDAVSAVDLLARRDGLMQISDTNNPGNRDKLRELKIGDVSKELAELNEQISNEVLWDPMRNYAAIIDQETPQQKEERLDKERVAIAIAQQSQHEAHEREMARIQNEASASQQNDAAQRIQRQMAAFMPPQADGEDQGDIAEPAPDERIFGSADSFGERFREKYHLATTIPASPNVGIVRPYDPLEAFNSVAANGLKDQAAWAKFSGAIESSRSKNFRLSARSGLLPLLVSNVAMRARRIDALANSNGTGIFQGELGPSPEGISQWLSIDKKTSDSLGHLFSLAGYEVKGVSKLATPAGVVHDFSDFANLTDSEISSYLQSIATTTGAELGIVRAAYTIFRIQGFPHGNDKMIELRAKYQKEGDTSLPVGERKPTNGDSKDMARTLERKTVAPLLYKLKVEDPGLMAQYKLDSNHVRLQDYLREGGMEAFIYAFAKVPANELFRKWSDYQLMLDMMDSVQDARVSEGAAGAVDKVGDKVRLVQDAMKVANAKRILSESDRQELLDPSKFSLEDGQTALSAADKNLLGRQIYEQSMRTARQANTPGNIWRRIFGRPPKI